MRIGSFVVALTIYLCFTVDVMSASAVPSGERISTRGSSASEENSILQGDNLKGELVSTRQSGETISNIGSSSNSDGYSHVISTGNILSPLANDSTDNTSTDNMVIASNGAVKSNSNTFEQILINWYNELDSKNIPTWIRVGHENAAIEKIPSFPFVFPESGAVLHSTAGGYRLDLSNVYIAQTNNWERSWLTEEPPAYVSWSSSENDMNHGIATNGDLAVFLNGESYIQGGILSEGNLLICGPGTLLMDESWKGAYYSSYIDAYYDVTLMGCSITINTGNERPLYGIRSTDGNVLLSGCMLGIYGDTDFSAIYAEEAFYCLGSMLSIQSTNGIRTGTNVVIDGSIVNMLVDEYAFKAVAENGSYYAENEYVYSVFSASHSYLSIASLSSYELFMGSYYSSYDIPAIQSGETYFDHCVAKIYSKSARCIGARATSFGEGDYYIGSGLPPIYVDDILDYAIATGRFPVAIKGGVYLHGGNVHICTPENLGIVSSSFEVHSGRLEMMDKFDVTEMLKFDADLAMAYATVATAGNFDVAGVTANFYSQIILDAVSNGILASLDGKAYAAAYITGDITGEGYYWQDAGTVWCDKSKYGLLFDDGVSINAYTGKRTTSSGASLVLNGGSFKGEFMVVSSLIDNNYKMLGLTLHTPVLPNSLIDNVVERNLKCVVYTIPGAEKNDKIEQDWMGILPSYYGTQSLYTDDEGKLYFWVSQNFEIPTPPLSQKLDLIPGWNLVTLERPIVAADAAKFLALHPFTLDANRNTYVRCRNKDDLIIGRGYWFFSTKSQKLLLTQDKSQSSEGTTSLKTGWNLVGMADNSIWSEQTAIFWQWQENMYKIVPTQQLQKGKAYFVYQ